MKGFWFACVLLGALYAQEERSIDALLHEYKVASDLSNQTKKESSGSLILYTREDLEKMHVFMLRDVLKTIPIFTLQEAFTGPVALARAGASSFNTQFLKLYINDHELGSVVFGSAMKMWGYMDMASIDHVEIYQTGSAVATGDEPPGLVIRLYTKDPAREKGGQVQLMTSQQGSYGANAYYADTAPDLSYFFYVSHQDEKRDPIQTTSNTIERSFAGTNLFGTVRGKNFQVDAGRYALNQDGLFGFGMKKTPSNNYMDLAHNYLIYTHYFQDRSLKLKVEYDYAQHIRYDEDPNKIKLNNDINATSWLYDKDEQVLNLVLNKTLHFDRHTVNVGAQFKSKGYEPKSMLIDGVEYTDTVSTYRRNDIYSLFISEDFAINANHLLVGTVKYDYIVPNAVAPEVHGLIARGGYVFNTDRWLWKTFIYETYGMPFFMQNSFFPYVNKQNSALEAVRYMATSSEIHYKTSKSDTSLRVIYNRTDTNIEVVNNAYVNTYDAKEFIAWYASYAYAFDANNKVTASYYLSDTFDDAPKSSLEGGLLQVYNSYNGWSFYNELGYRSRYSALIGKAQADVNAGLDYTVAIGYEWHKDLHFGLRGENLLGSAIETPYDVAGTAYYISPFDRVVRLTMKYLF